MDRKDEDRSGCRRRLIALRARPEGRGSVAAWTHVAQDLREAGPLTISTPNGTKAMVIAGDKLCSNAVAHIINSALVR